MLATITVLSTILVAGWAEDCHYRLHGHRGQISFPSGRFVSPALKIFEVAKSSTDCVFFRRLPQPFFKMHFTKISVPGHKIQIHVKKDDSSPWRLHRTIHGRHDDFVTMLMKVEYMKVTVPKNGGSFHMSFSFLSQKATVPKYCHHNLDGGLIQYNTNLQRGPSAPEVFLTGEYMSDECMFYKEYEDTEMPQSLNIEVLGHQVPKKQILVKENAGSEWKIYSPATTSIKYLKVVIARRSPAFVLFIEEVMPVRCIMPDDVHLVECSKGKFPYVGSVCTFKCEEGSVPERESIGTSNAFPLMDGVECLSYGDGIGVLGRDLNCVSREDIDEECLASYSFETCPYTLEMLFQLYNEVSTPGERKPDFSALDEFLPPRPGIAERNLAGITMDHCKYHCLRDQYTTNYYYNCQALSSEPVHGQLCLYCRFSPDSPCRQSSCVFC